MNSTTLSQAVSAALVRQRTALTSAGVLRTERPANVHTRAGVDLVHEDPMLVSSFYSLASAHPRDDFTITSAARSAGSQLSLWERYVRSGYDPAYIAARPGQSNHDPGATGTGMAEAIDALVNGRPIHPVIGDTELALYGMHAPVPGDEVHLTLLGVNG